MRPSPSLPTCVHSFSTNDETSRWWDGCRDGEALGYLCRQCRSHHRLARWLQQSYWWLPVALRSGICVLGTVCCHIQRLSWMKVLQGMIYRGEWKRSAVSSSCVSTTTISSKLPRFLQLLIRHLGMIFSQNNEYHIDLDVMSTKIKKAVCLPIIILFLLLFPAESNAHRG